jgi:hypothetical protein
MKKMIDKEILDIITESTFKNNRQLWLQNILENEKRFGFKNTIREIKIKHKKSIVLAAGPESKKKFSKDFKIIEKERENITIVACDGALSTLSQNNCIPDIIVSVDGAQIISKFYKNSKEMLNGTTVILSTSIHPDVVEQCIEGNAEIKWVQPFFNCDSHKEYFRKGIPSIKMGGNVGTASYLLTSLVLKGNPIGLMGIEFAWSDETPYSSTQYYEKLMENLEQKSDSAKNHFIHIKNTRDGRTYMADPVYYAYFLMLKEIWEELPIEIKENTFNLTKAGILNLTNLKNINIEDFVKVK